MEVEVCIDLPPGHKERQFSLPPPNKDQVIYFNERFLVSIEIGMGYIILIHFLALFG